MDLTLERDSSALGSLFQQIINDMKNTSPLWEDFVAKASKLHACLRAAIQAIAAYLDAFQKIADAATNSRGASKEIGTALTRVCLRHKAVETRLKTFTTAIMDCLVQPLQEKLEDWKRTVASIDKEHAKEYKRCRTELKKRSSDTLRLQKKARKGQSDTIQSLMDSHMQDVTLRRAELEEVEKKSLRSVMIEERMRYCTFVHMLQPVVKEECEVMSELGHLQEAMQSIAIVTKDPAALPPASEELIHDAKATMSLYPESPVGGSGSQGGCSNSLGSRKSSVCSISSINSSGSSGSPGHHHYPRTLSQLISPAIRLKPGESSDSGFCSSPALTTQASTATSQSHAVSTWPPHSQEANIELPTTADRPHTISTAYEKGHQRPPLTVYTFQNPETILESGPPSSAGSNGATCNSNSGHNTPSTQRSPAGALSRPPLPVRCSSLERPLSANNNRNGANLTPRQCPSPLPAHITKELNVHHAQQQQQQQQQFQQQPLQHHQQQQLQTTTPTYVNMSELANMAALKNTNPQLQQTHQAQPMLQQQHSIDSISSQLSNESTASATATPPQHFSQQHQVQHNHMSNSNRYTQRSHSTSSSVSSNPSLHSHPSIESAVATPLVGQTPTPSSGSSTPQNLNYMPLLTSSPSSTAAGTPSGCSITSGGGTGVFVYNVNSPTPPQSANSSMASDALKITEMDASRNSTNAPTNAYNVDAPPPTAALPLDITNTTDSNPSQNNNNVTETDSPTIVENDEHSRASVLQKASMFEKHAAAAATANNLASASVNAARPPTGSESIYGTRRTEEQRATPTQQHQLACEQQEVDKSFEDSIQELNNLIGELDSFQREIDESKQRSNNDNRVGSNNGSIDPFPIAAAVSIGSGSGSGSGGGCTTDEFSAVTIMAEAAKASAQPQAGTTTTTTAINSHQHRHQIHPHQLCGTQKYCSSNQTNSSGCGTDISDTTSDEIAAETRSLTSLNLMSNCHSGSGNKNCNYNSDSELSRCYVSETSSLTGGYENPTFEHFVSTTLTTSATGAATAAMSASATIVGNLGDSYSTSCSSTGMVDDSRLPLAADGITHNSDSMSVERHAYVEMGSDSASAVVVIYDHQIPITPDMDYVKQNSEIVVLRTKDPQQHQLPLQEMRELQQLPENLSGTPPDSPDAFIKPHTATVAPAKQRLSSFRASSEQHLQLLDGNSRQSQGHQHQQQQQQRHGKGTQDIRNSLKASKLESAKSQPSAGSAVIATIPATPSPITTTSAAAAPVAVPSSVATTAHSDTIIRRKLPPKPNLTVFNGNCSNATNLEVNNSRNATQLQAQTSTASMQSVNRAKNDFKADLDAKIRKQKQKLLQQELQHQKQQPIQQQQQSSSSSQQPQSSPNTINNCNMNNIHSQNASTVASLSSLPSPSPSGDHLATAPLSLSKPSNSKSNSSSVHQYQNNNYNPHYHSIHTNGSLASRPQGHHHSQHYHSNTNPLQSTKTSPLLSSPANTSTSTVPTSVGPSYVCSPTTVTPSASYVCAYSAAALVAMTATASGALSTPKPSITPRPASLSGGTTRIARRSSVNAAKPPPPVRRSSSVTPSPNVAGGSLQQQPQQQKHHHSLPQSPQHSSVASNLLQQQQVPLNNSTENLPPPPAYLLDTRQAESQTASPSASSLIPNSTLKVSETVKALAAMRHQPASPNALRHLHQHQQQPHQQPAAQQQAATLQSPTATVITTQTTTPTINSSALVIYDETDYDGYSYYNPYVEVNAHAYQPNALANMHNQKLSTVHQQQQHHHHHHQPYQNHHSNVAYPSPPPTSTPKLLDSHFPPSNDISSSQRTSHIQQQLQQQQQQQQLQYHHHHHSAINHHHNPLYEQQQLQQQEATNCNAIYGNSSTFRTSSPGIYAQPKIVNSMSSFRSSSPGANGHPQHPPAQPKTNPNLIAQLNARLSKQQQQKEQNSSEGLYVSTQASPNHFQSQQQQQQQQQNEAIYVRNYGQHQQQQPPHQQQHYDVYASTNIEKAGSIRSKAKAEFLENLNAKLAKQGMSGRAFAVRNYINSKALPDPRICHESLMDQIKRGATLKRNQKINDRSAPKIL